MQLSEHELSSQVWLKLSSHLKDLLGSAHKNIEKTMTIEETASLRGRIKLIRQLLSIEGKGLNRTGPQGLNSNDN